MTTAPQDQRTAQVTYDKKGNAIYGGTFQANRSDTMVCNMVPDRIIPVIFVPGVMGSNLQLIGKSKAIWLMNGVGSMAGWFTKGSEKRKQLLDPTKTEVFNDGDMPKVNGLTEDELKRRGWGEVGAMSYGEALVWLETHLNDYDNPGERLRLIEKLLDGADTGFEKLTKDEVALSYKYRFPVHAVGYNWLQSNVDSAKRLSQQVDKFIAFYKKNFKCEKAIIVTHSMGGLVARYYSEVLGGKDKILGIVHGVMPAVGAAAVYRRMKAGTEGDWGTSQVLGSNAGEVTAVMASAPGPLQLLPTPEYGMNWLKIHNGKEIIALPKADPYSEIYTARDKWWSLVDDNLIDPLDQKKAQIDEDWLAFKDIVDSKVKPFHDAIVGQYNPYTYAFCGADSKKLKSYGTVAWTYAPRPYQPETFENENLLNLSYLSDSKAKGYAKIVNKTDSLKEADIRNMRISQPDEAGDGTVPLRSGLAAKAKTKAFFKFVDKNLGHEPAYKNENNTAQIATLYSIVKIAQNINQVASMAYP